MCADRCFSNPTESNSSSDYTRSTKQKTIFKDVVNQVQGQTNFIKNNGVNYNENFGLHNQCLAFAKSYDLLLDVTKGKYYSNPVEDPNWVSNESWSAGLYSVDYSTNGVNVVVDTSYNAGNANNIIFPMTQSAELADISWNGLYPGVRVDPSYNIFYNDCKDQNYWREKLVDMSFNNTNYYKQNKQQSEQLYGMYYPANVTFICCVTKEVSGGDFITNGQLEQLRGCTKIIGSLNIIGFTGQPDFSVFDCLKEVTIDINITNNTTLTSISGFGQLKRVGLAINIDFNGSSITPVSTIVTNVSGFLNLIQVGTSSIKGFNAARKTQICLSTYNKISAASSSIPTTSNIVINNLC